MDILWIYTMTTLPYFSNLFTPKGNSAYFTDAYLVDGGLG